MIFSAATKLLALAITLTPSPSGCGGRPFRRHVGNHCFLRERRWSAGIFLQFSSVVKDGVLHGEKGTKGKPGWFQLDGKMLADGDAKFYADGLVGASEPPWDMFLLGPSMATTWRRNSPKSRDRGNVWKGGPALSRSPRSASVPVGRTIDFCRPPLSSVRRQATNDDGLPHAFAS